MSKIIIHNKSKVTDAMAVYLVQNVMSDGFVSGENQYCWVTRYPSGKAVVVARKTRGTTHTFEVRDL